MPGLTKRFIGHLQSNKVKKCIELFDTIDAVDSLGLAQKINIKAKTLNKTIPTLLEINTSGEPQKHGFKPDQIEEMLLCVEASNLNVTGLMTVGPRTKNKEKIRAAFVKLRNLRGLLNNKTNQKVLTDLSMGMSGDYEIAAEEGSTMVRVGTALFGKRKS